MNDLQASGSPSLIPILVGITGHRDLEDEARLVEDIGTVLRDLAKRFPATPIVLLTPLAEGADRAAARAVLQLKTSGMDISFVTILPMDEDEYIHTFTDSASVEEYHDLKVKGLGCYQVPVHESFDVGVMDKDLRDSHLYANMGTFLALNTQVLIAAWNGAEEEAGYECAGQDCIADGARCPHFPLKLGGTYHVLRMRFFGVEEDYRNDDSYLSHRESGPVYWIKTKRRSSDYLAAGDRVSGPAYPQFPIANRVCADGNSCDRLVKSRFNELDANDRTYAEILSKLNAFNMDAARGHTPLCGLIQESRKEFFSPSTGDMSIVVENSSIVDHYAVADCLSSHYQRKRRKDIILLVSLAFLGLLSYSLYSGPVPWYLFILGYTSIYMVGIMVYLFWVKEKRHHEKYVDYRGIAEALRVQFFWNLAGVEANATDVYLNKQKSSVSWIKIAVNNIVLTTRVKGQECSFKGVPDYLETVKLLWLEKQRNYYDRKQPQKQQLDTVQKRLEAVMFVIGLCTALFLAGMDTYENFAFGTLGINTVLPLGNKASYNIIHQWMVFGVGFLPVIIASFKVFTELMAYSKLARNFKWMRLVYSVGLNEFNRISLNYRTDRSRLYRKISKLLYDIGVEALSENGEWIGLLDDRVPDMPK